MRLVRPKSLRKLRESIKPRTRRNNGKSMEAKRSKPLTGEPDAGDPPVRFGRGSGTKAPFLPLS
jgi:hypothetical protein